MTRKSLSLLILALVLSVSAPLLASGKKGVGGSNPQFPAPSPACWTDNGDGTIAVNWTDVTSTCCSAAPTKYAIQIVVTEDTNPDSCGSVTSTNVFDFTAATNPNTTFVSPIIFDAASCNSETVVLIKALNPPGKSQNNPQALATAGCGNWGSAGT